MPSAGQYRASRVLLRVACQNVHVSAVDLGPANVPSGPMGAIYVVRN